MDSIQQSRVEMRRGRWTLGARHAAYAIALDGIACAMNIPLGSAVKLAKAVNGYGNAPRSWCLFFDRFMTSMGGRRMRTDPTVWCLSTEVLGTTFALAAAYVDDFIIVSILGHKFEQPKNALRERFRYCSWKNAKFCFVRCASSKESGPYDCS